MKKNSITLSDFKCFMIVIEEDERSEYYYNYCKPSWEQQNVEIEKWPAITPKDLHYHRDLNIQRFNTGSSLYTSLGLKPEITDTEKSVFYSHFNLWKECAYLNEPLLILEHDSYLLSPEKFKFNNDNGITFYDKGSMGCYIIQPWFAKGLVNWMFEQKIDGGPYRWIEKYAEAKDILKKVITARHKDYLPISNQVMSKKYGNTIEHYCTSKEFYDKYPNDKYKHKFIVIE